jgi:hypothetical protein
MLWGSRIAGYISYNIQVKIKFSYFENIGGMMIRKLHDRKRCPIFCYWLEIYRSRHQLACFKVTVKSYNVATRTAEPRRVKTVQNSQRSKASNVVLVTAGAQASEDSSELAA